MPVLFPHWSAEAEDALRAINALAAFFVRASRATRSTVASEHRVLMEATIVRAVSIVEAYVARRARSMTDARLADVLDRLAAPVETQKLVEYVRSQVWEGAADSWPKMTDYWKLGLEVPLTDDKTNWGAEVSELRQTRHAIVHELGEITERYRRLAGRRLRAAGLDPKKATGLIPLEDADVDRALRTARGFIDHIDTRT